LVVDLDVVLDVDIPMFRRIDSRRALFRYANEERCGEEEGNSNHTEKYTSCGLELKRIYAALFNPKQPKVFGVKFSLRKIERIFSIKIRNLKLWKMFK